MVYVFLIQKHDIKSNSFIPCCDIRLYMVRCIRKTTLPNSCYSVCAMAMRKGRGYMCEGKMSSPHAAQGCFVVSVLVLCTYMVSFFFYYFTMAQRYIYTYKKRNIKIYILCLPFVLYICIREFTTYIAHVVQRRIVGVIASRYTTISCTSQ